jgi:hypothetical protein
MHGRQHASLLWLNALLFALGPATGVERAWHLGEAAHRHDAERCTVCFDLSVSYSADELPAPTTIEWAGQSVARIPPRSDQAPIFVRPCEPLVPRAPPA